MVTCIFTSPTLYTAPALDPVKPRVETETLQYKPDWRPWVMSRLREVTARGPMGENVRSFSDPSVDLAVAAIDRRVYLSCVLKPK